MRRTLIVLTAAGLLSFGLIVTALSEMGIFANVNAMNLMDPISRMHDDGQHQPMHAACHGDMTMAGYHRMASHSANCPYGDRMLGRVPHGAQGLARQHQASHGDCPISGNETMLNGE